MIAFVRKSALALALVWTTTGTGPGAQAATITLACGAVGIEYEECRAAADAWADLSGNTVLTFPMPNELDERLEIYDAVMRDGTGKIDVFLIDAVWPALLGDALLDLTPYLGDEAKAHFPEIIENNTVGGELKAIPLFLDTGTLYFRRDLLERHDRPVPSTWNELAETARLIQNAERTAGNPAMWGLVFQGQNYEGLTCNALEWIGSSGGGHVVEFDGTVSINNAAAVDALGRTADWIGDIVPNAVLEYDEEAARYAFQEGNAVFMRNWPYAWSLLNSPMSLVSGDVGIAPLPSGPGGAPVGTVGGWQVGVSKHTNSPREASDLVRFLTSRRLQRQRAVEASYAPTRPIVYEDLGAIEGADFMAGLVGMTPIARPSTVTGAAYGRVSQIVASTVHKVLAGKVDAATALAEAERELEALKAKTWAAPND